MFLSLLFALMIASRIQRDVSKDVSRLLGSLSFEKSTLEHSLGAFQRGLKQGVQGYIRLLANWLINVISFHSGSSMNLMITLQRHLMLLFSFLSLDLFLRYCDHSSK